MVDARGQSSTINRTWMPCKSLRRVLSTSNSSVYCLIRLPLMIILFRIKAIMQGYVSAASHTLATRRLSLHTQRPTPVKLPRLQQPLLEFSPMPSKLPLRSPVILLCAHTSISTMNHYSHGRLPLRGLYARPLFRTESQWIPSIPRIPLGNSQRS